ncbi:AAA family ATPase [Nocardia sp. NPDC051463]|uniref:ParA family protein n=1 Tax=Nocardia sp. NPDC051463 TaxID=3154845 RepID=UPI003450A3D0
MAAPSKARIIALANQKGGVGKTTTTLCLARAASHYYGARVLVLDMDMQGNATSTLAKTELAGDDITIADAITPGTKIELREVIVPTIWDGVDLAPGGQTLAVAEQHILASQFGREQRLREAVTHVRGDYDLVLIDNAPALGMLLVNSLVAADAAVLIAEPHRWSSDGLAMLGATLAGVRGYHNPSLEITGCIVNKWRGTASEKRRADEMVEGFALHFPGVPVWLDRRVPLWTGITETLDAGLGLDQGKDAKLRVLSEDVLKPFAALLLDGKAAA